MSLLLKLFLLSLYFLIILIFFQYLDPDSPPIVELVAPPSVELVAPPSVGPGSPFYTSIQSLRGPDIPAIPQYTGNPYDIKSTDALYILRHVQDLQTQNLTDMGIIYEQTRIISQIIDTDDRRKIFYNNLYSMFADNEELLDEIQTIIDNYVRACTQAADSIYKKSTNPVVVQESLDINFDLFNQYMAFLDISAQFQKITGKLFLEANNRSYEYEQGFSSLI